ncbi:MAG: HAD hydrolase-like protein [Xanthomonadales bacterium]|nr:HAD hydrolase-like protein [Xanthomonadales bacterium]
MTRCVAYAFERIGEPLPDAAELRRWLGPPLRDDSFRSVLHDDERIERAIGFYRERFDAVGFTEHRLYDGIGAAIEALSDRGHRVAVVTAKNEPHARRIVAGFDFAHHFDTIVGATLDGRVSHKPELIGEAMARLALHAHECVMIGDRHLDIDGARHHGMRAIGVLWGFGTREELAHADALVDTPAHLINAM